LHSGFCHSRECQLDEQLNEQNDAPAHLTPACLACTLKRVRRVFSGARVVEHVELSRKGRRATKA
jgi:hypothetical protein